MIVPGTASVNEGQSGTTDLNLPVTLSYADILAMKPTSLDRDFQCVTGWRVHDVAWKGVRLGDVLDRAAAEIAARKDELGELLAREEGKTRPEAVGEVARAGQILRFAAGEAVRNAGELIDSVRPGITVEITREPVGVVGLITPWNFPIAIPAWKAAPALAFGNAVILKPAALVPASAWALVDVLVRAGVPEGVLGLVFGPGGEIGNALVESDGVNAISFTGSVETGRGIAEACARRGVRVQLEMGGKNPLVVLDDADLEIAVDCALQGAYFSTGQRCTASSRLVVTAGIHDRFVTRLIERLEATKVGHALDASTAIGPVVDERQLQQAVAGPHNILAVETWNEFSEGTDVAETVQYERRYIQLTRQYADRFKTTRTR